MYCFDKIFILFGEKFLFDLIEGWLCDVREDFFMFGICFKNCLFINKDFFEFGCSIGMYLKNGLGFVGFLYELIKYGFGFFIVLYVVIVNCYELYVDNSFLLNYFFGKEIYLIVYLLWLDNKKSNCIVGKVVELFYGEYKLFEELYEGLDFVVVKIDYCRVGGKCCYICVF